MRKGAGGRVAEYVHDQLALFRREHCYRRADLAAVEPMVGLAMYKSMLKWGQP